MSFPLVTRRRYERDLADATRRMNAAIDDKDEALEETRVSRQVQRFQIGQRHQADRERARLRRELGLSETARRALDAQRRELIDANDQLSRQLVDRAGTLAAQKKESVK